MSALEDTTSALTEREVTVRGDSARIWTLLLAAHSRTATERISQSVSGAGELIPGNHPCDWVAASKIRLKPGESQQVNITVSPRTQSVWDTSATDWRYIPDAVAYVGSSSRDIRLKQR